MHIAYWLGWLSRVIFHVKKFPNSTIRSCFLYLVVHSPSRSMLRIFLLIWILRWWSDWEWAREKKEKNLYRKNKNYVGKILYSSIKPLNCRVLFLSSLISSLALFCPRPHTIIRGILFLVLFFSTEKSGSRSNKFFPIICCDQCTMHRASPSPSTEPSAHFR